MGSPKPTLGYPSRTAAVLALRQQRLTTAEIGARIGIPPQTVAALEASTRRERGLSSASEDRGERYRTVLFPIELLRDLRPHAVKRDITVNELARQIVEAAIQGKLVDAVLDDMETTS
jgi:hypothetical protein